MVAPVLLPRLAKVVVSQLFLIETLRTGCRVCATCVEGIPPSAELERVEYNEAKQLWYFVFRDQSFKQVPPEAELPCLNVVFRSGVN